MLDPRFKLNRLFLPRGENDQKTMAIGQKHRHPVRRWHEFHHEFQLPILQLDTKGLQERSTCTISRPCSHWTLQPILVGHGKVDVGGEALGGAANLHKNMKYLSGFTAVWLFTNNLRKGTMFLSERAYKQVAIAPELLRIALRTVLKQHSNLSQFEDVSKLSWLRWNRTS